MASLGFSVCLCTLVRFQYFNGLKAKIQGVKDAD
jgi:hypothetical protein